MGVLYNQVADRLQALIQDGVYRDGDRVPGVRLPSVDAPEPVMHRHRSRPVPVSARETLDYAFPGKESFRRQIAQRMASVGVPVRPDDVLVTNGAQEAI